MQFGHHLFNRRSRLQQRVAQHHVQVLLIAFDELMQSNLVDIQTHVKLSFKIGCIQPSPI